MVVNVSQLEGLDAGSPVTPEVMKEKGLIRKLGSVKILGNGELTGAVTVHAHKFSRSAVEKIEKSGGKAITV
jgi:large subunit ribosomal protein L15